MLDACCVVLSIENKNDPMGISYIPIAALKIKML